MEGFPELDASIGGMAKGKLVGYVRAVFRHVVPKDHEKVFFIMKKMQWGLFCPILGHTF